MNELNGRQKRHLRSLGQRLGPAANIGKAGLTSEVSEHISRLLEDSELIKIRLGEVHGAERKRAAAELADAVGAELVGVVGRNVLLYRENPRLPQEGRILPSP